MGGDQKQSLADTARKAIDEYFDFKAEEIKSELRISGTKTVNYLGLYDFVFTPLGKDWSSQGFPWGGLGCITLPSEKWDRLCSFRSRAL